MFQCGTPFSPPFNFIHTYYVVWSTTTKPVYGHPKHGYNCEEIVHILLDPVFADRLLSTTHPVSVEHNVLFVIDLNSLSNPNDVRADDLGSWKCTGSRCFTFTVKIGPTTRHIVNNVSGSGGKQVQIR